jgi:MFS family permease
VITVVGIAVLLALGGGSSQAIASAPGLFLLGFGMGSMLTPSVNVVQSSFPEELQGEISGLSRSVSNLGSSLGTAVAGTVLVAGLGSGDHSYAAALVVLGGLGLVGLAAAVFLPGRVPTRPDGSADVKPAAV